MAVAVAQVVDDADTVKTVIRSKTRSQVQIVLKEYAPWDNRCQESQLSAALEVDSTQVVDLKALVLLTLISCRQLEV